MVGRVESKALELVEGEQEQCLNPRPKISPEQVGPAQENFETKSARPGGILSYLKLFLYDINYIYLAPSGLFLIPGRIE